MHEQGAVSCGRQQRGEGGRGGEGREGGRKEGSYRYAGDTKCEPASSTTLVEEAVEWMGPTLTIQCGAAPTLPSRGRAEQECRKARHDEVELPRAERDCEHTH